MKNQRRPVTAPPFSEQFVDNALKIGAIELEERQLKSGRLSPYFFNSGKFDSGHSMTKIATSYARVIRDSFQKNRDFAFDILYGPPYKGTMLVPAIAMTLDTIMMGLSQFRFCSSRKEVKRHGEGGLLIGAQIRQGDRVLIVDDVITDGWTKKEAVKFIEEQGGKPVGLVIAFDRQEKMYDYDFDRSQELSATQKFGQEYHIPVVAVATLNDLIKVLERQGAERKEVLEKIRAYQKMYGV
jgi:orotate phosphoribosyltransferase